MFNFLNERGLFLYFLDSPLYVVVVKLLILYKKIDLKIHLLHPQHPKGALLGHHPEPCPSQAGDHTPSCGGAVAAVWVADVVEQASVGFEDAVKDAVQLTRIEVPGQGEGGRVVQDGVEGFVLKNRRQVGTVADQQLDVGAGEEPG